VSIRAFSCLWKWVGDEDRGRQAVEGRDLQFPKHQGKEAPMPKFGKEEDSEKPSWTDRKGLI